jgi:biopolymer transport protein TolR
LAFQRQTGDPFDHLADINVTPLVDVMLVLLIIFMVTAPMLHQGVSVALPKTATTNLPTSMEDPVLLSITKDGLYYINETPVARGLLRDRLERFLRGKKDRFVLLKADRGLSYGTVVETLDLLNRMGIEGLGMVTDTSGASRTGADQR